MPRDHKDGKSWRPFPVLHALLPYRQVELNLDMKK